jgi:anti-sigma regulatory factor (Ser/Thr protein kinase)
VLSDQHAADGDAEVLASPRFRHDAMLYATDDEFLAGIVPFLRAGVAAGEPVLVVLAPQKNDLLRDALGRDADRIRFADMRKVGRNPARIIPAWADFLAEAASEGRPVRGIGEPVWASRDAAEQSEALLHEALLNRAFADRPGFWLRCPYDMTTLPAEVLDHARRTHPIVGHAGPGHAGPGHPNPGHPNPHGHPVDHGTLDGALPEPPAVLATLPFDHEGFELVRRTVREHAVWAGLDEHGARRLVLAVHEIAANSVRHGGGRGTLRVWREGGDLVCEVQDAGRLTDPMVGRVRPRPTDLGGRGVWMANQLCDLVQIRSTADGTVVRLRQRVVRDGAAS